MINWKAYPFLRLLLPLILGIVLGNYFRVIPGWYLFVFPVFCLPFLFWFVWRKVAFRQRVLYGWLVNIFLISFGFGLVTYYPEIHRVNHFSGIIQKGDFVIGVVSQPPKTKKRKSTILSVRQIIHNNKKKSVVGQLYVSFPDTAKIYYGQLLVLQSEIRNFPKAGNPYSFDFGQWQYFQNVHYQSFIKGDEWHVLGDGYGNALFGVAFRLRQKFHDVLKRVVQNSRDLGVASALVLGVKDDLTDETKDAFSSTGAMHVLAVSGLHVGIVSVGLRWLMLLVLGRSKARRWWRLVAQLLGVWFFVLLTGAGASVLRAGVMFTIVELGLAMDRRTAIFNSIAASAFLLLSWNPFLLFQVGFQLSYLALSGIVFFHSYIYKWITFESDILDFFWKLGAVSMAAQVTTFPLAVYYFHQFPLSFFLSGLIVVPAATALLPLTILLFLLNFVSVWLADMLGVVVAFLYHLNTKFIFGLSQIDWMKLDNIYFSEWTVVLAYALVVSIMIWLALGRKLLIFYVLGILTLMSVERNVLAFQAVSRQEMAFFKLSKTDGIGFIQGRDMRFVRGDSLAQKKWMYATSGLLLRHGVNHQEPLARTGDVVSPSLVSIKNFYFFNGRIIEFVSPQLLRNRKLRPDILFFSQYTDTADLAEVMADTIVLGVNIFRKNALALETYFVNRNKFVHNIRRDGGLLIEY